MLKSILQSSARRSWISTNSTAVSASKGLYLQTVTAHQRCRLLSISGPRNYVSRRPNDTQTEVKNTFRNADVPSHSTSENSPRRSSILYVANIPYSADENDVHEAFSSLGNVKQVTLGHNPDGTSRGFAHVQFDSIEEATRVYESDKEDPVYFMGRDVHLNYAFGNMSIHNPPNNTLFVSRFEGTEGDLRQIFEEYKEGLRNIIMLKNPTAGQPSGALVSFKDINTSTQALNAFKTKKLPVPDAFRMYFARPRKQSEPPRLSLRVQDKEVKPSKYDE